jgi:hypothetical protein
MLQLYAVPHTEHLKPHIILQQDGATPYCSLSVGAYLDEKFPGSWVDREGPLPWHCLRITSYRN